MSYPVRHPVKAKQCVARQSGSIERSSRGFGTTPGGRAFVWLLTLTSIAVVLAVYFSFRGANDAPRELPAETGAASSLPSPPESDALVNQPATVLPPLPAGPNMDQHVDYSQPDYFIPVDETPGELLPGGDSADGP